MDSINRSQTEETIKNLASIEAVKKIKELVKIAETAFFCTAVPTGKSGGARPMSVQQVDDAGNLWFVSASDSHTNLELEIDPSVNLFMQGSAHSDFLHLTGEASISTDPGKIKELWRPMMKTWFTEGSDDPRITVIKVTPKDGYYWDTKHGNVVAGVKVMIGALIGKTMDDSQEGKLRP